MYFGESSGNRRATGLQPAAGKVFNFVILSEAKNLSLV